MREFNFFVPGKPVPKQSVRVGTGRAYIGRKSKEYMKTVAWETKKASCGIQFEREDAIHLRIKIYLPIPTSVSDKEFDRLFGALHRKKPDASNYLKGIEDGIVKSGVVWDDAQFSDVHITKYYEEGDGPGVWCSLRAH